MGDISIKGSSKILRTGGVEPFEITPLIGPKGGGGKIAGKQFKKFKKIIKKTPGKQINKSQKKKNFYIMVLCLMVVDGAKRSGN